MLQSQSRLLLVSLLMVPVLATVKIHPPQERVTFGEEEEEDPEAPEAKPESPLMAAVPTAIQAAVLALESAPGDPAVLKAAAEAAQAAGLGDEALWYANLALELLGDDPKLKKDHDALVALRTAIGLPGAAPEVLQAAYAKNLFEMAKACEKKKLYTNAADLLQLCYGTAMETRAEERLEKLFSKEAAVEGLLETGIPIDIPVRRKVNAKTKRLVDSRNTDWENAYSIKGKFYTVKSDMGYDYTHAFLEAMDQINGFYREVFGYKTRGGDMRTCAIEVYKGREEFDIWEKKNRGAAIDPNVRGFFVPGENRVATYDPRSEGGTIADLWSTLFHEASHQFTAAVAPGLLLTWLNEGTASYFEGAFLQPGGSVATNRVPESRLRALKYSFDALAKGKAAPTLTQVVTWYKPGSYEGEYYPYGWGLVYFMHNFEDSASERVYLPVYKEFLASYKNAAPHDVLARFKEYFVTKAKVHGIDTFEQFDAQWQAWIQELYKIYFGGPEQALVLMARAEKQLANKKPEYARDSLQWAVEKDPKHVGARLQLAKVLTDLKKLDGAAYHWRMLESAARANPDLESPIPTLPSMTPKDLRQAAQEALTGIQPQVGTGLQEAVDQFVTTTLATANAYVEGDRPLAALQLLEQAKRLVAGDGRLRQASMEIRDKTGKNLVRGYRPRIDAELSAWTHTGEWIANGEAISTDTTGLLTSVLNEPPPLPYRFETKVRLSNPSDFPVAGIAFASTVSKDSNFAWLPTQDWVGHFEWGDKGPKLKSTYDVPKEEGSKSASKTTLNLALEVYEDRLVFYANGKLMGSEAIPSGSANGRVGVFAQGTGAEFSEMRLIY